MQQTNWRERQEVSKLEGCRLTLAVQNSKDHWCVDSGFSRHMIGNKNTFKKLLAKIGTVTFGNDNSSKVLGKGTVTLGSKDVAGKDVLLIEKKRHNLLSVSQMCVQGHVLTFTSKDCKIRREDPKRRFKEIGCNSLQNLKQHIHVVGNQEGKMLLRKGI